MTSLRSGRLPAWGPFFLLALAAVACGPTYSAADDDSGSDEGTGGNTDGSGGEDGSGGDTDSGGSNGSGGSDDSGGSDSSGGTDASGGSNGSGGESGSCSDSDQCVAAADFDQPCFSPDCGVPVAATQSEVERNPCLVLWEDRHQTIPEQCAGADDGMICPANACVIPPPCVSAACNDVSGECELVFCAP